MAHCGLLLFRGLLAWFSTWAEHLSSSHAHLLFKFQVEKPLGFGLVGLTWLLVCVWGLL